jgi:hypothetical protein
MIHLSFGGILSKWCSVHGFQFQGVKIALLQCLKLLLGDLGLAGIGVFIDDPF